MSTKRADGFDHVTFADVKSNLVVRVQTTRTDFISRLLTHTYTTDKAAGGLFSPVVYAPKVTKRGKAGIEKATALAFDVEAKTGTPVDQVDVDRVLRVCRDREWEVVIYSTHSHQPNNYRLRLVLFPSRPVEPPEFAPLRAVLKKELSIETIADPAAEDISRIFYWPAATPGSTPIAIHQPGGDVDVDELLVGKNITPFVGAVLHNVPEGWTYTKPAPHTGPIDIGPLRTLMSKYKGGSDANPEKREYRSRLIKAFRTGERFASINYRTALLTTVGVLVRLSPNSSAEEILCVMKDSLHTTYDGGDPISYDEALEITKDLIEKTIEKEETARVAREAWEREWDAAVAAKDAAFREALSGPAPKTAADLAAVMENYDAPLIVYSIPTQSYVYPDQQGYFPQKNQINKEAAGKYLIEKGVPYGEAMAIIKTGDHKNIYNYEFAPHLPPLFLREGLFQANTWRPSKVVPAEGAWDTIDAILDSLTYNNVVKPGGEPGEFEAGQDIEGKDWFVNWLALAVQHPDVVPGTAVLLNGMPQGSGKNTLNFIMQQIIGPENCADISNTQLESRFNSRWASKCFVFADEIYNRESTADITDKLKILVTGQTTISEAKGKNEVESQNRAKYLFASNNTSPLRLDAGDRRFTVFTRHAPISPEYTLRVSKLFTGDNRATPEFEKEIAAFAYYLERYSASLERARRPHNNPSKAALVDANTPMHQLFFAHVDEYGIDDLLEGAVQRVRKVTFLDDAYGRADEIFGQWDFGDEGVAYKVIYQCYVHFAQERQNRPLGMQKFGHMLQGHPTWARRTLGPQSRRVVCNKVPRKYPAGYDKKRNA